MATVTKSTLNKKLGQVSTIRWCTDAGVNMCYRIFTGENGRFSMKVGFKQGSTVNPFQVQYRQRSRWTAANAKKKGANWTAWGDWKAAAKVGTLVPKDGVCSDAKGTGSRYWKRSNVGVNKKGAYKTCYTFTDALIGSDYDGRQYQFRVRRYNSKTKKHGLWVYELLGVYKSAVVVDETMHRRPDGGIIFDFNMKWEREGIICVDSIMDAEGRELLVNPVTRAVDYDSRRTASSTPALRDGYTPGQFEIEATELKRQVEFGETLTLNVYYKTGEGAKTAFACTTISEEDLELNAPRLEKLVNEERGIVQINAYKADAADDIETIGCSATYTYHGKAYTMQPHYKSVDLEADAEPIGKFWFRPPLGVDVTYQVTIGNSYDESRQTTVSHKLKLDRFILTNTANTDATASIYANGKLTYSSTGIHASGLTHGRSLPVVFFGTGGSNKMTLTGVIVESSDYTDSEWCKLNRWSKVRNNQNGLYLFRTPDGDMYNVMLSKVDISASVRGRCDVTVDMEEVSK